MKNITGIKLADQYIKDNKYFFGDPSCNDVERAFLAGWDAAMELVKNTKEVWVKDEETDN